MGESRNSQPPLNVVQELLNPQTLGGDRYDTLVITEKHDSTVVIQYEDSVRSLRHYHERFIAGSPQGQTYLWHPWWDHYNNPAAFVAYERETRNVWECVVARVNHSLAAEGRADRIQNIPASSALAELVSRATAGNLPGITAGSVPETMRRIFTDDVHVTTLAWYYLVAVNYAAVYRRSPVGGAFPSNYVTAAQANVLQNLAWEFVSNYYATYMPKTLAQCQRYMPAYCTTRFNYIRNPGGAGGCAEGFSSSFAGNPFNYNAATDRNYWLPPPSP